MGSLREGWDNNIRQIMEAELPGAFNHAIDFLRADYPSVQFGGQHAGHLEVWSIYLALYYAVLKLMT